jgi:hypothetical protein
MAVGDEGLHAAGLGKRQRLLVHGFAHLGVEPLRMGRHVAEEVQRSSLEPRISRLCVF